MTYAGWKVIRHLSFTKEYQMKKKLPTFSERTSSRLTAVLLRHVVKDMRFTGLTDRAIARKLELPRWMVRAV